MANYGIILTYILLAAAAIAASVSYHAFGSKP